MGPTGATCRYERNKRTGPGDMTNPPPSPPPKRITKRHALYLLHGGTCIGGRALGRMAAGSEPGRPPCA